MSLVTGPCTDPAILARRTELLCGIPAVSMARMGEGHSGRAGTGRKPEVQDGEREIFGLIDV